MIHLEWRPYTAADGTALKHPQSNSERLGLKSGRSNIRDLQKFTPMDTVRMNYKYR